MLVTTASLVVRKERIWQRRESGRLLILSTPVGFEFELAIQSYFVVQQKLGNNRVWSWSSQFFFFWGEMSSQFKDTVSNQFGGEIGNRIIL